ncbi:MAG TPA: NYN domain-containing protein, partial [Hyphomicrobiaceae bacterium]|nr:NYN domain-containing protein [Hyphomicrobiaceae bacterium]
GAQTVTNIVAKAHEVGIDVRRDDVRFILEVVSEADPWFEQGASANLFAGRFRNFVVGRCRSQGLNLSADELDLVEAWFAGSGKDPVTAGLAARSQPAPAPAVPVTAPRAAPQTERSWSLEDGRQHVAEQRYPAPTAPRAPAAPAAPAPAPAAELGNDEFPRIVRTRLRG